MDGIVEKVHAMDGVDILHIPGNGDQTPIDFIQIEIGTLESISGLGIHIETFWRSQKEFAIFGYVEEVSGEFEEVVWSYFGQGSLISSNEHSEL